MTKTPKFDFGKADKKHQQVAITTTEGPLLITAGPGTGKTFTLVKRIAYLIQIKGVKPEEIMVATFTEKAAKELVTRISNELIKIDCKVNLNEMYIGTFHSICLRFIKEHLEDTHVDKNFKLLDDFDQKYLILDNFNEFKNLPHFDRITFKDYMGTWDRVGVVAGIISNLMEELVDVDKMLQDSNPDVIIAANLIQKYQELLKKEQALDFTGIQVEAYKLFVEHPEILDEIREKIKYIMVDEYQDTNYIQEQLVFMLAGDKKNICVVGDDDQGLYRFRGATIRNILEFKSKFKAGECAQVDLTINYRSEKEIIDFYNEWMEAPGDMTWGNCRLPKTITPGKKGYSTGTTVLRCSGNKEKEWHANVHRFITTLKDQGVITNYNQVAVLCRSVKNNGVLKLIRHLESNGIPVYSPRSDMFFERGEIKKLLGVLILCFPGYEQKLRDYVPDATNNYLKKLYDYYKSCTQMARTVIQSHVDLKNWMDNIRTNHGSMAENTDYAFSGLLYQILEFEPFKTYISTDVGVGVKDERTVRNVSIFTEVLGKFEYYANISVFSKKNITFTSGSFFDRFVRYLFEGGIDEYEDESEYAPSGCVSFLTIHQAKGMEFPIVMVDSLYDNVGAYERKITDTVVDKGYYHRQRFESTAAIPYYDFWRLYYTAFSRAQNLLLLTCFKRSYGDYQMPSSAFEDVYNSLPEWNTVDLSHVVLENVKPVNLKQSYSFTSHIELYENCPRQYKFFKELGFTPVRIGSTMFGTLVHQTIEDIHRAAIRHETDTITDANIEKWLDHNYLTLKNSLHASLGKPQLKAALRQVKEYVKKMHNGTMPISVGGKKKKVSLWDYIQEAEYDVSEVRPDYILKGTIDLIRGDEDTVEIVDFKTSKKPEDLMTSKQAERYRRQLEVYAHLVQERTGKTVTRMHLYYTGEETTDPIVSFDNSKKSVTKTIKEFDEVVAKIQQHDFSKTCNNQQICDECDMRYYCGKVKKRKQ